MITKDLARQLREDVAVVVAHVAHDANGDYCMKVGSGTFKVLLNSLPRFGDGEPMTLEHLANLEKVLAWVRFVSQWNARFRALTPEEQEADAAARRLQDAIPGA